MDEKRRVLRDFFGKILDEKYKTIEESTHLFQKEWNLVENKAMGALEKLIEQKWSREDFEVRVSINPVCPRNLDSGSFDIFYRISVDRMIAVSMHELLHFIYFSKFKELFPEISKEEYNRPHLAWHLSEIIPGVILNDIKMQEVFAYRHKSYGRYYEIIIGRHTLMEHIQKTYNTR